MRRGATGLTVTGKLRSLELLRAVAALLVVLFHTQAIFTPRLGHIPFGDAFGAGYRGVDLFFVLSGFIIASVHAGDAGRPRRLPSYLYNRVTRIYPAVWVMTALAIGLYSLGLGGADKAAKLAPTAVAASALLLPQPGDALVNVTWTLTYEVFFYALFGIVIANRRAGLALLLAWQVATAVLALSGAAIGPAGYFLRSICLEFGVGLACAWWLRRAARAGPAVWWVWAAAGTGSFVAGLAADTLPWAGVACAAGAGGLLLGLVRLEQGGHLRVPDFPVRMGGASYAIYLVHFSTITVLAAAAARLHIPGGDAAALVCAALGIAAGFAFDAVADKPMQRWLRRRKATVLAYGGLGNAPS